MVDAVLASITSAPPSAAEPSSSATPRRPTGIRGCSTTAEYVYLVLRPQRIQVWRESNELAGRTVMRGGAWVS